MASPSPLLAEKHFSLSQSVPGNSERAEKSLIEDGDIKRGNSSGKRQEVGLYSKSEGRQGFLIKYHFPFVCLFFSCIFKIEFFKNNLYNEGRGC